MYSEIRGWTRQKASAWIQTGASGCTDPPSLIARFDEVARTTLAVLFIGVLIAASGWILRPFLPALIWATMVVVATWPVMLRVQRQFGNRRAPAVMVMTCWYCWFSSFPCRWRSRPSSRTPNRSSVGEGLSPASRCRHPLTGFPNLPLIGAQARPGLDAAGGRRNPELTAKVAPYAGNLTKWFAREVGSFGLVFVQFLLTVALSAVLYSGGEQAADEMLRFGRRLAGERGEGAVVLAGQAVRAVALGVGITAFVQSVLGGIGLAIAGVPFATVLTALMFMLCIAQLGPTLVLAPAVVWLYWSGDTGWGTFLLVWTVIVGTMDNFLRPLLIKQGADLPLLLILAGVIGGLLAFGLVGIFVGPVVLAVSLYPARSLVAR
jgi:predicted PurR-regulated permease PerM